MTHGRCWESRLAPAGIPWDNAAVPWEVGVSPMTATWKSPARHTAAAWERESRDSRVGVGASPVGASCRSRGGQAGFVSNEVGASCQIHTVGDEAVAGGAAAAAARPSGCPSEGRAASGLTARAARPLPHGPRPRVS